MNQGAHQKFLICIKFWYYCVLFSRLSLTPRQILFQRLIILYNVSKKLLKIFALTDEESKA